jgi:DHA2 family multidrug resistance protein
MTMTQWLAVFGGALGAFMAILDIQVTNASLREISGALNLSLSESGWISTSYLIAEIIVIPLTAFFSQVFSLKKYILFNCFDAMRIVLEFADFNILSNITGIVRWNFDSAVLSNYPDVDA